MIFMEIRKIKESEMKDALKLVWEVFLEFEAPCYTEEGINEFKRTIDDSSWIRDREFYGAFDGKKICGVIATKDKTHIALFFVDGALHGRKIGRKLYDYVEKLNDSKHFTVNSSPFARDIYHHLGFKDTMEEQCVKGLRFIPMEYYF